MTQRLRVDAPRDLSHVVATLRTGWARSVPLTVLVVQSSFLYLVVVPKRGDRGAEEKPNVLPVSEKVSTVQRDVL